MALRDEFERAGRMFRWRSLLPLLLLLPLIAATRGYHWPFFSEQFQDAWEGVCMALAFAGLLVRVVTVGFVPSGTSGRNTVQQVASELNTTGMYSIVRHPLYLGNFLIWFGIALFLCDTTLAVVFVLVFWLYYERIMFAEEAFLRQKFGATFESWAAQTPAFFPRPRAWVRPSSPFSFRRAIRREYTTLGGIGVAFLALDVVEHWIVERTLNPGPLLTGVCLLCLACYLIMRSLKKWTTMLRRPA